MLMNIDLRVHQFLFCRAIESEVLHEAEEEFIAKLASCQAGLQSSAEN